MAWYQRMLAFGYGNQRMISGAEALAVAAQTEPDEIAEGTFIGDLSAGQEVEVMPIDYGFQPVRGELISAGLDEIALVRTDPQVDRVVVHFPRLGFQVKAVS